MIKDILNFLFPLLEILTNPFDEYNLYYACCSLRSSATRKSFQGLTNLLQHKKQDISAAVLNAVLNISNKIDLPLFVEHLGKRQKQICSISWSN